MMRLVTAFLFVASVFLCDLAGAQDVKVWEEYGDKVGRSREMSVIGGGDFGEQVDTYMGGLSFSLVDVDIPGNNLLPVQFGRVFNVRNNVVPYAYRDFALSDWEISLPSISADYASDWTANQGGQSSFRRCSVGSIVEARPMPITIGTETIFPEEYWNGITISTPSGGGGLLYRTSQSLMPNDGREYYWVAGDDIRLSCLPALANRPGGGEGFYAVAGDGRRYSFDWMAQDMDLPLIVETGSVESGIPFTRERRLARKKNSLYPTRVEDHLGNWVKYTYSNAWNETVKLSRIESSDGRVISIAYNSSGLVDSVTAGARVWRYEYSSVAGGNLLASVRLPDMTKWSIDFSDFARAAIVYKPLEPGDPNARNCSRQGDLFDSSTYVGRLTHPSGAVAEYTVGVALHSRSNVPLYCKNVTRPSNNRNDDIAIIPVSFYGLSLLQKGVYGSGVSMMRWMYEYWGDSSFTYLSGDARFPTCPPEIAVCSAPLCASANCAGAKKTAVTAPDGSQVVYRYGNTYGYDEGKLNSILWLSPTGVVEKREVRSYDLSGADGVYPARWGISPKVRNAGFTDEYHRPMLSKVITQDGVDFTVENIKFDSLARPTNIVERSDVTP